MLSAELQAGGIQLELLTGPLTGSYDPNGMGAVFFAVLAVAGQIERNYIREKSFEGQATAEAKDNHGGRPKAIDDDMLTFAVALKDKGVPVPQIARKLVIKAGKNADKNPRSPRSTGHSPKPRPPRRTTACRCGPSPSASAGPRTRSPPRRSTSAKSSRPSPTRTGRSAARAHDRSQRQRLYRCSPRPDLPVSGSVQHNTKSSYRVRTQNCPSLATWQTKKQAPRPCSFCRDAFRTANTRSTRQRSRWR